MGTDTHCAFFVKGMKSKQDVLLRRVCVIHVRSPPFSPSKQGGGAIVQNIRIVKRYTDI